MHKRLDKHISIHCTDPVCYCGWSYTHTYAHMHTDALDYGQHKKAMQIADKILKKQKDLKCAKVKPCPLYAGRVFPVGEVRP